MQDLVGQHLGDFAIVRELGRGGMGVVYEARQVSLNRRVALKVLSGGLGLTPKAVQRFHREAEAAAKLHHTNIVPVYATGEEDGTHFYAMELIDGPSLDAVIRQMGPASRERQRPEDAETPVADAPGSPKDALGAPHLDITGPYLAPTSTPSPSGSGSGSETRPSAERYDRAAAMIAEVADALHHAHQQGVTHRDIKPSNLLLSSDGRLSVTDFGLARILEQPGMTVTGEFVGTPAYMSPEQVTAGRIPIDHRTDIYSLGATLYELITLRPPFRADGRDKLLAMVIQKEPAAPRSVDAKLPRDLETICLKCLEKDPDRRYPSAKELADDLRRYVNRFAILARRAGPVARAKKWVKRNRALAAAGVVALLALAVAGVFAVQAKRTKVLLRDKNRQAAVDQAILDAMSGDAEAGLRSIAQAEQLGADPGELNMLRGLVELNSGRTKEAIVHLEQAEKQWPDSVAVKALLTTAYLYDGQYARWDQMVTRAEQGTPKTTEDFIFLGQAQIIDPRKALETLIRAPARARQSPVARLTRAIVQSWYAEMTGRVEDADEALKDVDRAELPDNPLLLTTQVKALLVRAHAAGSDNAVHDAYWKQARRVVEHLARFPDLPIAIVGRCFYYYVTGDDDTLLQIVREGTRRVENDQSRSLFHYDIDVLYRRRQFDQALAAVGASGFQTRAGAMVEGIIRATLGQTDQAERLFLEDLRMRRGGSSLVFGPAYFQLLGPGAHTDARQVGRDILNQPSAYVPAWRNGWLREVLKFNAGEIDAAELEAKAGTSRFNQCEAFFYIGLRKLADLNRAEAKEYFTKSYETGVFQFGEYMWSRAFLANIDDPKWLPWCVEKR